MALNDTLFEIKLKKLSQELASHKIELQQVRGYLQCILQNSNDMIFATDVDGMLVSFSKGGEKILGYSWDEVAGMFISELSVEPEKFEEMMEMATEKGSAERVEFPFRHKNGDIVYCDVYLITLNNTKGQRVGTVGVCKDITKWKKLQDELIRIDRLVETGRLASGIAHEINNPLAIINEATGWALDILNDSEEIKGKDREELISTLRKIDEQTRRCRTITHQLLGFVRDSRPERKEMDLQSLLRETVDFLIPELKHTSIEVSFHFLEEPIQIRSDPRMMEQIFVNLLTNAIHAIKEKGNGDGKIDIYVHRRDSQIQISIQDNGIGIPEDNKDKIFSLFFTTKPPGKGTGLGLSICQDIIKKLGGSIDFKSEYGKGTTFTVTIPEA